MKKSIGGEIIDMEYVNGKTVATVGYDDEKRVLTIEFTRGPVLVYDAVPKSVYEELIKSPTPDGFFEDKIRHVYKNKRVC